MPVLQRSVSLPIERPDHFANRLYATGTTLVRRSIGTLQVNIGKLCNQACHHCHVEAGPGRTELMTWETMQRLIGWIDQHRPTLGVETVDITGGAPEMNRHFRPFVAALRQRGLHVLDRCNLTILHEPGYEDLAEFFAAQRLEVVASLPCYLEDNVDKQRGKGVFHDSITALQKLNGVGYGLEGSGLKLDLVYNPTGYGLPPPQAPLEADYKRELAGRYGIAFNRLWTITNMPIKRFEHALLRDGKYDAYVDKLRAAHRDENVANVMCRDLISVGWQGTVYDCDFNQMIQLPTNGPAGDEAFVESSGRKIWEYEPCDLIGRSVRTGTHCFGCTAGAGSSCTGAIA